METVSEMFQEIFIIFILMLKNIHEANLFQPITLHRLGT